jgi:type I restriction enzyme, S subunit
MSFPQYERFRDSGVEWLGHVPEHWAVSALKRNFDIVGGSTPKSDQEAFWDGDIPWVTPADLSKLASFYIAGSQRMITEAGLASCGTTLVPPGSLILSTRAPIGSLAIAQTQLCMNQGCKALVARGRGDMNFMAYLLSVCTVQLNNRGKGTTFLELSGDELGAFKIPQPSVSEQIAIVTFLNRETAKIDALVDEQQRLIDLLQEKRHSIISHAVTKGLDPKVPMKNSGIEWFGAVPAHWEIVALKHLVSRPIIDGPHESPIKRDEGIPFLSAESVSQGSIDFDKKWGYISPEDHAEYSKRYKPQRGDILLVKLGATTGTPAIVDTDADFNIWVPLAAIRVRAGIEPLFILYVLQSDNLKIAYELNWTFGTQQTLGLRTISNLRIPIPPKEERQAIIKHLDSMIPLLQSLIAEAQRAIGLLQERRAALIWAAVTGKINVGSSVPDEAEAA